MIILYRYKVAVAFLAIGFFIGTNFIRVEAAQSIEEGVSYETGLDNKYIEYIYKLSLNNTTYMDKFHNNNRDIVLRHNGPVLKLGNTYYQVYNNIRTVGIERPSEYFLPDSIYSVSYDIKTLMQYRYYKDRGGYQRFFDSFTEDIKQSIVFCEAVLTYIGEDESIIDNFTRAYEMYIVGNAQTIEESLNINGITNAESIQYIKIIFDLDKDLAKQEDIENKKDVYEMPYIIGYTSRENLLESAFSLVGKVRYTWAGGHAGTSNIKGINPVWQRWEQLYEESNTYCIKPSGSWCPVHGYNEDERCINYDLINDYNKYLELRADTLNDNTLLSNKYKNMLNYIDTEDGTAHRLDGLDCSGYTSWIFNQVSNKQVIDSSAMYFTQQQGIESIEFGSNMMPGDIFAWTSHIVVIVGKVNENSKVYVTVEQTPNVLKFGTLYYSGYKQSDLDYAMQIAREANQLIGNTNEEPHSYCMNNVGHYSVELESEQDASSLLGNVQSIETKEIPQGEIKEEYSEESQDTEEPNQNQEESNEQPETQTVTIAKAQYIDIGRLEGKFIDEDYKIGNTDKTIQELNALDIIQYIITKLPVQYISGYTSYSGSLLDKDTIATSIGTTIIREK